MEDPGRVRLLSLELENIRCFDNARINFADSRPWTVILGDNGAGKSTLLRSIALALASPKEATAMFERNRSNWLRDGQLVGAIRCEVLVNDVVARTELQLRRESYGETLSARAGDQTFQDLVWTRPPFVAAYGSMRGPFGTRSQGPKYSLRDASATLFDADAQLQNPELAMRRLIGTGRLPRVLLRQLDHILLLPEGSTELSNEGLVIRGQGAGAIPLSGLSDGYRSTLTWVIDMLGWAMQHAEATPGPPFGDRPITGIVLIDEIEQHLHPSWQRRIIRQLRAQFPDIQFIVSTHAPLCVVGTTDLDDKEVALCVARNAQGHVEVVCDIPPPRRQRADQVVTSFLFGLDTSGDNETKAKIARLSKLLGMSAPPESVVEEIQALESELEEILGADETEMSTLVAKKIREAEEEELRTRWKAASFEARRQLAEFAERLADESADIVLGKPT
jgi:predicted ATPase